VEEEAVVAATMTKPPKDQGRDWKNPRKGKHLQWVDRSNMAAATLKDPTRG